MSRLYQKFLFDAGKAVKSSNKLANAYGRFVVFFLSFVFHFKKYNYENLVNEVEIFNPNVSEQDKKKIIKETKRAYFKFRCSPHEYFIYDLKHKTKNEIKDYLFDIEKIVLVYLINSRKDLALLNSKQKSYEKLKQYYKRDIINMGKTNSLSFEEFRVFVKKHPAFIVKANNLSCGRGMEVYKLSDDELSDSNLQSIYERLKDKTPIVIEEFLRNDNMSGAYYDKSLNILRVVVFKTKEGALKISNCNYYIGMGNQEVTNGAVGAITVLLDPKTGIAISNGFAHAPSLIEYEKHPDSGLSFRDLKAEKWDEVLDMVQKLSEELPSVKYVGWDLALTKKGWCIIEGNGNAGQTPYQIVGKKSNRAHFMNYYCLT